MPDRPLVIAHRGYSAAAPENTLAAFEAALRAGADLLELDVRLDADGEAVVLHDASLERTTDAPGTVEGLGGELLRTVDAGSWFAPAFSGQRVPTLAEVAQTAGRFPGAGLLVEFKGVWSPAAAADAVAALRAAGVAGRSVVQSFEEETVAALRDVAPDVRRALLVLHPDPATSLADVLQDPLTGMSSVPGVAAEQARRAVADLGVVAVNPHVACLVASPHVVAEYHAAGVRTWPYTVDEPHLWDDLLRHGVDGLITNDPGRLRGFLDARAVRAAQDAPPEDRAELTRAATLQGRATPRLVPTPRRLGLASA
ncbi:glycerophosphodiester phosphodiesterase [Kineococcus sp. SYSU DK006]|uniref:glycerophosphodiester phosphodiesterase n=1 Tax=Kineococcus sp. SYSU DK006 TaxID=3383127 RepID=UPI003D7D8F54